MVDSIMDNLSLRTQRRALMQLELSAESPPDTINTFVQRARHILTQKKDKVENFHLFLASITKNTFVVHVEFYTAPVQTADFYEIRQEVNLALIGLMEELNIKLATKDPVS
jgi:MscS family membrane protein